MRPLKISAVAFSLALAHIPSVSAQDGHTHLEAHEHGAGELMIALEEHDLVLELRLPGMDTVGFEHAPQNDDEHKAIKRAVDKLKVATNLVELPGVAQCILKDTHVSTPSQQDDHESARHDEEDRIENHGEKEPVPEYEHGHGHEGETHSEFMAEYHFRCDAPQNLDTLNVKVFTTFPTLEEIVYQLVGPNGQVGGALEPGNTTIGF